MKKLAAALSLSLFTILSAGCGKGKHEVVKMMEDSANKVCACKGKGMECLTKMQEGAEDAEKKEEELEKKYKDWKPSDGDKKAMEAAEKKMEDCMEEIMKEATK